ncbi:MAG: Uma2 family endonuclease [Prosthecobacter sp.]|uniref:Uma2 family endonuclease n=1 Tax=Prosthecobacter sp. TaxID=1965333 RepID=UPI003902BC89
MPAHTSSVIKTARRAVSTRRVRQVTAASSTPQIMRRWQPEQRVVLSTTWKRYLAIDKAFGDNNRPGTLLNYGDGQLEIMTTSSDHERIKIILSRCLEAWLRHHDIVFYARSNMTRRVVESEKAVEADESYSFARGEGEKLDLAIEVALSSGGLNKLPLYEKLGHPEVWIWRRGKIQVHAWDGAAYQQQPRSVRLPKIPLQWIEELACWRDDYEAVSEFHRRLKAGKK